MGAQLTIVMISMHTSPLAQPGQGDAGGLNVYIRNLMQALTESGHQVLAFTRKTSAADTTVVLDDATGSKVIPLSVGRLSLPKEALGQLTPEFAASLLAELQLHAKHPIVLHSHYWLSGAVALQVGDQLDAPVIHTMHTLGASKNHLAPGTEPKHRLEQEARICATADMITANTRAEKRELTQFTGVVPDRVQVVHPGVDHEIFQPEGPAVWPGRTDTDGPRILFAGRQQQYKGPHVLLQALAVLRDRGLRNLPTVHFTGAASGATNYDVQAQAHLLGVAPWCSFSAPVTPKTLASYMRAADVVAMPSVSESFGLVALEAQACGTPVIAHKIGGLTTAVEDGVTGRLVDTLEAEPWAEVMATLGDDAQRWASYGEAAVTHAQHFSWVAMAQRMIAIYSRALNDSVGAASKRQ